MSQREVDGGVFASPMICEPTPVMITVPVFCSQPVSSSAAIGDDQRSSNEGLVDDPTGVLNEPPSMMTALPPQPQGS